MLSDLEIAARLFVVAILLAALAGNPAAAR